MKVLVTGGAGYVGTALTDALARQDGVEQVVVYDNLSRPNPALFLSERLPDDRIRFVRGDVLDTRRMQAELAGVDLVYHLAARVSTPFADEDVHGLEQVNHWGTAELSYLLENSDVKRCVYLSTTSVYGSGDTRKTLDSQPQTTTAYGISKLRGEEMIARLSDRMPVHIVRCGNVYGYNKSMRFDAVVNRFMLQAHTGGRLKIHGTGMQARAFVHIGNLVGTLVAMGMKGVMPGLSNVVERTATVEDLASAISQVYPDLELVYVNQDTRLRNLLVEPDPRLAELGLLDDRTLEEQLQEFRTQFAFEPSRK